MPRRQPNLSHTPRLRADADLWDVQRDLQLLANRLQNEQALLATWQRRLALRTAYEQTHAEPTQLPALRQECAACHSRVLNLARRVTETTVHLRTMQRRQDTG